MRVPLLASLFSEHGKGMSNNEFSLSEQDNLMSLLTKAKKDRLNPTTSYSILLYAEQTSWTVLRLVKYSSKCIVS